MIAFRAHSEKRPIIFGILLLACCCAVLNGCGGSDKTDVPQHETAAVKFWTCSMHPQIKQPGPGLCPICAMELIPVLEGGQRAAGERELKLSETAMKLAEIQTAPVERKYVAARIRMDGKIAFDETRLAYITAWVPGRIEKMYVDYTGVPVKQGEHLVELYSPELITTQKELLLGLKLLAGKSGTLRTSALENVGATRKKLKLWGLTPQQIARIEKTGRVADQTTIHAPISGIVIRKDGFEGMYVQTGTRIYTVADLSQLWVLLDAYEADLIWVRYGQQVEFTTSAYPGRVFQGRISFIDPTLNAATRTVKVRVNVANPDGLLKPEMFVTARVYPQVTAAGMVMDPALSDKWICSMHPEIIKPEKGACDICGMPLVTAESLGYVTAKAPEDAPLVIPASAPLITGTRAVVYVAVPDKQGVFEGREIVLGPRAGDHYIVAGGLAAGERVVTNGSFKIDSALQILAKPSMMSESGVRQADSPHAARTFQVAEQFKLQLGAAVTDYLAIHTGLSADKVAAARAGARRFADALTAISMQPLSGKAHHVWMQTLPALKKQAAALADAKTIESAREQFSPLSETLYRAVKQFGSAGTGPLYRFHCPMAFDNRGADWLQQTAETENPYFGAMMYRCGSMVETIVAPAGTGRVEDRAHD